MKTKKILTFIFLSLMMLFASACQKEIIEEVIPENPINLSEEGVLTSSPEAIDEKVVSEESSTESSEEILEREGIPSDLPIANDPILENQNNDLISPEGDQSLPEGDPSEESLVGQEFLQYQEINNVQE